MTRRESPAPTAYGPTTVLYVAGGRRAITTKERTEGFRVTAMVKEDGAMRDLQANGMVVGVPASTEDLEFRVVAADGSREIKMRVTVDRVDRSIAAPIPAGWLEPGDYRVELRAPGSDRLLANPLILVSTP